MNSQDKSIYKLLFVVTLSVGVSAITCRGERVELSLRDAFEIIEAENYQILIRREAVEEALRIAFGARSQLLPRFDFQATQLRSKFANVGRGFEFPDQPPSNRFDAKFTGSIPLFDVSSLAKWRLSKFDYDISQLNYDSVLQVVLNETTAAYFTHLRNRFRIKLLDANIERDRVLLDLAQNQLRAGVATQIDVTRAEVEMASDQKERIQQDTVVMESELRLKKLLNVDLDAELELQQLSNIRKFPLFGLNIELENILSARPDYQQATRELERNQAASRLASLEVLPAVSLFGEWGYATSEIFDGAERNTWLAGVAFRIPLFEGFRIRSNRLRANAVVRAQEIAIRDIRRQVGADYRLAVQDVESRYEQIAISERKVSLSEEELELARTRFTEGVADNRDVIDAQAELAGSNDELLESIFLFNISRLNLATVGWDVKMVLSDQ